VDGGCTARSAVPNVHTLAMPLRQDARSTSFTQIHPQLSKHNPHYMHMHTLLNTRKYFPEPFVWAWTCLTTALMAKQRLPPKRGQWAPARMAVGTSILTRWCVKAIQPYSSLCA
jgi:hypothetical protein